MRKLGIVRFAGEEPYALGLVVADFPRLEFSNRDVKCAGEVIAGDLVWTDEAGPEIRRAFQIANNWRDAHAYPGLGALGLTVH